MSELHLTAPDSAALPAYPSPRRRWPWRGAVAGGVASVSVGLPLAGNFPKWAIYSNNLMLPQLDAAFWMFVWFGLTLLVLRLLRTRRILATAFAGVVLAGGTTIDFVASATPLTWDDTVHNDLWIVVLIVAGVAGTALGEWLVDRWSWIRLGISVGALVAAVSVVGSMHEDLHQDRIDELPPAYGIDSANWTETAVAWSSEGYPTEVSLDVVDGSGTRSFVWVSTVPDADADVWGECLPTPVPPCRELPGGTWVFETPRDAYLQQEVDGWVIDVWINPRRVPVTFAARAMATLRPLTDAELDDLREEEV